MCVFLGIIFLIYILSIVIYLVLFNVNTNLINNPLTQDFLVEY